MSNLYYLLLHVKKQSFAVFNKCETSYLLVVCSGKTGYTNVLQFSQTDRGYGRHGYQQGQNSYRCHPGTKSLPSLSPFHSTRCRDVWIKLHPSVMG